MLAKKIYNKKLGSKNNKRIAVRIDQDKKIQARLTSIMN